VLDHKYHKENTALLDVCKEVAGQNDNVKVVIKSFENMASVQWDSFPGENGRAVKLTIHLHLAPGLMRGAIPPLHLRLHGVVLT
jgi:hypothetical protein